LRSGSEKEVFVSKIDIRFPCDERISIAEVATGHGPWTMFQLIQYMKAARRREIVKKTIGGGLYWLASIGLCESVAYVSPDLTMTFQIIAILITALYVYALYEVTRWRTVPLDETDHFWRDGTLQKLPPPVYASLTRLRELCDGNPPAAFVSFLGRDPILSVLINGHEETLEVWDELPDGTIKILEPPLA